MTKLNTNNNLLTVGELKDILKNVPDDTRIRYRKVNITTGLDRSSPVHRADVNGNLLFIVTEYVEQTNLDTFHGEVE